MGIDGRPMSTVDDLQRLMVAERIKAHVPVSVVRAGEELELELTPAELELGG